MKGHEFFRDPGLQKASVDFISKYGGRFGIDEPGDGLVYVTSSGENAYTPSLNATRKDILATLEGSVSQNLVLTTWHEVAYASDVDY